MSSSARPKMKKLNLSTPAILQHRAKMIAYLTTYCGHNENMLKYITMTDLVAICRIEGEIKGTITPKD